MVQLYKEDWTILHMLGCRAVALPSTEQTVLLKWLGTCTFIFIGLIYVLLLYCYKLKLDLFSFKNMIM